MINSRNHDISPVNLPAIERRKDKLVAAFLASGVVGRVFSSDEAAQWLRIARRILGDLPGLTASIRLLFGRTMTVEDVDETAALLAANVATLEAGKPVHSWTMQVADEWALAGFQRGDVCRLRNGEVGTEFRIGILSGSAVGKTTTVQWSRRAARAVADRLGFSRRVTGKFPFQHPMDLVGLRAYVKVSAERSRDGPAISDVEGANAVAWNRQHVLKRRCRVEPCPKEFEHPCWKCVIGADVCGAAVHAKTFELGGCSRCGDPDAVFDPESPSTLCVNCTVSEVLSKSR